MIKDRPTGKAEVPGPPQEWTHLRKSKLIWKGQPAKASLTIFGEKLLPRVDPESDGLGSGEIGSEPVLNPNVFQRCQSLGSKSSPSKLEVPDKIEDKGENLSGCGVPPSIARHGPGFLELSGEEKTQIRRCTIIWDIPLLKGRLAKFLKERHAEPHIVRGAWDFQCDSCAASRVGFDSARPAAIHDDLGFNEVIGVDTAVWANHQGQQYLLTHVIDEGMLFDLET